MGEAALGTAALNAARNKDRYLGARYRRLATRRSKGKAVVAIQHTILVAIWHMETGALYDDLGADYNKPDPTHPNQAPSDPTSPTTRVHRDPPARQLSCHSGIIESVTACREPGVYRVRPECA